MADALTSALVLDKLNKRSRAPRRRRRTLHKGTRSKKKRSTRNRKWKYMKTASGILFKVPKEGYMSTPKGRYVRKTIENVMKYYPGEAEYPEGAMGPRLPFPVENIGTMNDVPANLREEIAEAMEIVQYEGTPVRVSRTQVSPRQTIVVARRPRRSPAERDALTRGVNSVADPGKRQVLQTILDDEEVDMDL